MNLEDRFIHYFLIRDKRKSCEQPINFKEIGKALTAFLPIKHTVS